MTPNTPTIPADESGAEPAPTFKPRFAALSALALAVLGVVLLWRPARTAWDIAKSDWLGDRSDDALASSLSVPLTVLGGALIMIGTWMALVEWRGRFKEPARARSRSMPDVPEIIAAIGKLRGAALVLVVGAALMLASAGVAASAAGNDAPAGANGAEGASRS